MSPELALMLSPRETYAALARVPGPVSPVAALRRPLLVTIVIGVSIAIAATRRVSPALVASTTLAWSYVVMLQLAIAILLLAAPARRGCGVARAVDLFFAGHAPWSLFALAAAAWAPSAAGRPLWPLALAAIAALMLTLRTVAAFFAEVLGFDAAGAWRMTMLHQAMTWSVFWAIVWVSSALTPRLLEVVGAR